MNDKPLQFIELVNVATGRKSSIAIHGRLDTPPALTMVGNLEHNDRITPTTIAEADRLIKWLKDWKALQPQPLSLTKD